MSRAWDSVAEGRGALLSPALDQVRRDRKKKPDNWLHENMTIRQHRAYSVFAGKSGNGAHATVSVPGLRDSWHNPIMPTRSSKHHDFMTVGRRTVEKFIGEKLTGKPLDDPNAGKNPAAVALGKLGGAKGGAARAAALSPARRKAIAKKAALAR